jgi:hypothetical protein
MAVIDAAKFKGREFIVLRDRRTRKTTTYQCRRYATGNEVLLILKKLKDAGRLPLVLGSDNGSPFCCQEVDRFLEENHVIHLRSLPHTPEHNGACERAVQDIKRLLREDLTLNEAVKTLNQSRKRRQLGWLTACELDEKEPTLYHKQEREMFYHTTKKAIEASQGGTNNALERRKAERRAIMQNMQRFNLATITRGGQAWVLEPEDIT